MTLSWHVAKFFYGHEHAAAKRVDLLASGGPRAFCPVKHRRWVVRGQERTSLVPVISGYVFVEMGSGDPHRWHDVAGCDGFHGFIGGDRPEPCRAKAVEDLIIRSTEEWVLEGEPEGKACRQLDRGTIVRITFGHLENCHGVVEWSRLREDGPVAQVKVNKFFGIDIRAEVPMECLERVGKQEARKVKTLLDLPVLRAV